MPSKQAHVTKTLTVAGGLFLAGCATAGSPALSSAALLSTSPARPPTARNQSSPAMETPGVTSLQPSQAARRVADRVSLTGLETGTMWTFENPPLEYWKTTYGFQPTTEWLEHVRLSSVRFGEICSASFVSPGGLVMTNHHCARDCAEAVSDATHDYVENGFYAASREQELLCPGLYLDQLVRITDVSETIKAAARRGLGDQAAVSAQDSVRKAEEEACHAKSGHVCQVVSLYHGGQYQLYEYQRYAPVKLVFIPELQAAYFGGDPDNFTYPRYDLDMAFVRAYEPDSTTAASTPEHFQWDPAGADENELVFITGNPGSTSRLATVSKVMYEQQFRHPFVVMILQGQRSLLQELAARGPQVARAVRDNLFSVENSLKAFTGELTGLRDSMLVGRKIRWEREFREAVERTPDLRSKYEDAWDQMEKIQEDKLLIAPGLNVNNPEFLGGPYENLAGKLVAYIREMAKPTSERDKEYQGDALAEKKGFLQQRLNPDPEVARSLLTLRLKIADRFLTADDPFRALAFKEGETASEAAQRLISETPVMDIGFRQQLIEGGLAALEGTTDGLMRLALHMDSAYTELTPRWEAVTSAETRQEERLADALFSAFGTDVPPDATFTLRISDGVIQRYPYNGTYAPPHTTFFGLYGRSAEFGNEMPWTLADALEKHRSSVNLSTPLNFVATNDITGGNSGSPVIDRDARIVGLAFDGNIEQLPNEFLFSTKAARSVAVHSSGILEALRSVYQADALLAELLGESGGTGQAPGESSNR